VCVIYHILQFRFYPIFHNRLRGTRSRYTLPPPALCKGAVNDLLVLLLEACGNPGREFYLTPPRWIVIGPASLENKIAADQWQAPQLPSGFFLGRGPSDKTRTLVSPPRAEWCRPAHLIAQDDGFGIIEFAGHRIGRLRQASTPDGNR